MTDVGILLIMAPRVLLYVQCESKKSPPEVIRIFFIFFTNGYEFLIDFLHTYYTFLCTLDYKFLFNYLQL